MWKMIAAWLGLHPELPFYKDVEDPYHGQEARNSRSRKVLWDEKKNKWVVPGSFSDRKPVTITKGRKEP